MRGPGGANCDVPNKNNPIEAESITDVIRTYFQVLVSLVNVHTGIELPWPSYQLEKVG